MALIKCHECGAEISDAAKACPKCGAPVQPQSQTVQQQMTVQTQPAVQPQFQTVQQPAAAQTQPGALPPRPDNGLIWSILNTVLCCVPLGIWAIIKSNDVNRLYDSGNYKEAEESAKSARNINLIGAGLALFSWIIVVILAAVGALADL